ncbi:MAG TPA: ScpA family protein [Gemmatimonadales bacterium]|jgi:segregation and condensation protein A
MVRLDAFSGPLDLLLHLIREQEIDIADIPIAVVADQFLEAIATLGLNEAADYLEMAAMLLRIKIQMLLPRPFDDEHWEDPRAALVRRLLEYEQIRELATWIAGQASGTADRFARGWQPDAPDLPPAPIVVDLDDLLSAANQLIESMPQPVLHRVVPRPLDVEGASRRIIKMLDQRETFDFRDALGPTPSIVDVLSVLLALLELARVGRVVLRQSRPFADLGVRREPQHVSA